MKPARALLAALAIMLVAACSDAIPTAPNADDTTVQRGALGSGG